MLPLGPPDPRSPFPAFPLTPFSPTLPAPYSTLPFSTYAPAEIHLSRRRGRPCLAVFTAGRDHVNQHSEVRVPRTDSGGARSINGADQARDET